jgi:hypothetical protein
MNGAHLVGIFLVALLERPDSGSRLILEVSLSDATGLPDPVRLRIMAEVDAIYSSAGVRIEWVPEHDAGSEDRRARVYVLERLPGGLESRTRAFRGKEAMGAFLANDEGEGSAIYVSRSSVCANGSPVAALSDDDLSTALGRVVAHELAHRFISRGHGGTGILKESLLPSDLTGSRDWMRFTEEQLDLIHRSFDSGERPGKRRNAPR